MKVFNITSLSIKENPGMGDKKCLHVNVEFTCPKEDIGYFYDLNQYYNGVCIPDVTSLEEYDKKPSKIKFVPIEGRDTLKIEFDGPSSYDLGLCKNVTLQGLQKIFPKEYEEDAYSFSEYIVNCDITQACIKQLTTMKNQLDNGKDACFRSGNVAADFAGIIKCLDMFWD